MNFKYEIESHYCPKINEKRLINVCYVKFQPCGTNKIQYIKNNQCSCTEQNNCEYYNLVKKCCPAIDD